MRKQLVNYCKSWIFFWGYSFRILNRLLSVLQRASAEISSTFSELGLSLFFFLHSKTQCHWLIPGVFLLVHLRDCSFQQCGLIFCNWVGSTDLKLTQEILWVAKVYKEFLSKWLTALQNILWGIHPSCFLNSLRFLEELLCEATT